MRLLLETHALIWFLLGDERISPGLRSSIGNAERVCVSAVTGIEISIKTTLGKLQMPAITAALMTDMGFDELPVTLAHAGLMGSQPLLHRDPFDRLLIAQAQVEGLSLVTKDEQIRRYTVDCLW